MNQNRIEPTKYNILIVDDHELILAGTLKILKEQGFESHCLSAKTAREARERLEKLPFDLVIIDLSIPETTATIGKVEIGIKFLREIMQKYPTINIMVQSVYLKALNQIKHEIDRHQGGFTIADKNISEQEMLTRLQWALQGVTYTKDIRTGLELKEEWLEILKLAAEGLSDKAIADRIQKKERTVRNYWSKVQDVLGVYSHKNINLRVITLKRAREKGLID